MNRFPFDTIGWLQSHPGGFPPAGPPIAVGRGAPAPLPSGVARLWPRGLLRAHVVSVDGVLIADEQLPVRHDRMAPISPRGLRPAGPPIAVGRGALPRSPPASRG